MKVSRFVSLGAAVILSALQWLPLFTAVPQVQSVRVVGTPVRGGASDGSMPVVVITAHRA